MRKLIASLAAAAIVAGGLAAPAAAQRSPRGVEQRAPRGEQRAPRPEPRQQRSEQRSEQRPQQRQQRSPDPSRSDQASARQEMQAGRTMSSREIERRIVPSMKGSDYLGFEYDSDASAYRLKFIREGHVTWVDVDARTGRVLRVSK